MADPIQAPYIFDRNAVDSERLKLASTWLNRLTAEACARAGVGAGQRAVDIGCGELGALSVLADLVTSTGTVVGIEMSANALDAARDRLAKLGLAHVNLVQADVNELEPEALSEWQPFDLAVCRLLLMHQRDPAETLRRIARIVRKGGRIVAQDPWFDTGLTFVDPPVPAVAHIANLVAAHLRSHGHAYDVGSRYGEVCEAAGLRLIDWRGTVPFAARDTAPLEFVRRILPSQRTGLLAANITTDEEIEALGVEVTQAIQHGVRWAMHSPMAELVAEVPN